MFLFCVFTGIIRFSILKPPIMIFILKNWLQLKPLIMIFILKNTKLASALLVLVIKNELQIFLSRLLLGCQESYSFMLLSICMWVPTSNCGHLLCNMQFISGTFFLIRQPNYSFWKWFWDLTFLNTHTFNVYVCAAVPPSF